LCRVLSIGINVDSDESGNSPNITTDAFNLDPTVIDDNWIELCDGGTDRFYS